MNISWKKTLACSCVLIMMQAQTAMAVDCKAAVSGILSDQMKAADAEEMRATDVTKPVVETAEKIRSMCQDQIAQVDTGLAAGISSAVSKMLIKKIVAECEKQVQAATQKVNGQIDNAKSKYDEINTRINDAGNYGNPGGPSSYGQPGEPSPVPRTASSNPDADTKPGIFDRFRSYLMK